MTNLYVSQSQPYNVEFCTFRVALEPLFGKYGVDMAIWAHEHSYERLFPIYNYKMYNGSTDKPFYNPGAPVHFTTGSAVSTVWFITEVLIEFRADLTTKHTV